MNILKFKNTVLSALLFSIILFSNTVLANVGSVVYGYGSNHAIDSEGNRRNMRKGSQINEGDTLVTGFGRMHIRLIDGGFVSIYPNSEYMIEKFSFSGSKVNEGTADDKAVEKKQESKEDRGFFSLLKGAARQVTGLLGRTYNNNFKFKTVVATIGIRGTGFFARLCQGDCFDADGNPLPDGLHVKNNTGIITVTTNAGEVALAQGQSAFAASSEDSPTQTIQPPVVYNLVTPDIELYDFDDKIIEFSASDIEDVIESSGDGSADDSSGDTVASIAITHMEYSVITSKSSFEQLNGFDLSDGSSSVDQNGDAIEHFETEVTGTSGLEPVVFDMGAATLAESGKDETLGVIWNRWQGRYTHTQDGVTVSALDENIHMIGSADLTQNLPTGGLIDYVGTGGTTSFAGANSNEVGTQDVFASINFGSMEMVALDIQSNFSNATVNTQLEFTSGNSIVGASGSQFSMVGNCSGSNCGGNGFSLRGKASLHIVGPAAEGIYGVYNLTSGTGENALSGSYFATEDSSGGS